MSDLRSLLGRRGLYYSDNCFKDNFQIFNKRNMQIPKSDFDNIKEQDLSNYEIRMINSTITLECSDVRFSFCNGEYFLVAFGLIQYSLKGSFKITIYDQNHKKKNVSITDKISSLIRYDLKIECHFPFKNLKGYFYYNTMNYFSTVKDAKSQIFNWISNCLVTPNEITIYDENKQKIDDPNRKLISIPNFENVIFYSKVDNSKVLFDENLTRMAKRCYRDSNVITNYLVKKGLFYSDKCLKTKIHLYVSGCEVKDFMFKSCENVKESLIEIKDGGNTTTINYNGMKIILCDDETISVAIGLIHYIFNVPLENVSILDSNNRKLPATLHLKDKTKYIVNVIFKFTFKIINSKSDSIQDMDFLSTVNDAKLKLSLLFSTGDLEKVVIYDENKTEVKNPNLKLIDIPNYQNKIFCKIDACRRAQPFNDIQVCKSDFNPERDKNKRSSSPPAKEHQKSHQESEYPSFALPLKEDSQPSPKPAQKIQSIHDEKQDKKVPVPEPESEVIESTRPSRRRVKIKGPTISAIKDEKNKQSPVKKVPIKKQSSSDDEAAPNTHKGNDEDNKESNDELMINFVFSKDLEKKYYPFKKKLNRETTVKEICDMIKEKCKIEDQIKISYKYKNSFCEIDPTMNIDGISDEIVEKESNGKSQNFLYIDMKKQVQRNKSDPVKKKDEPIRKSRNISSSDDGSASPSTKTIKVQKKAVAHKTSHDTNDVEKPSLCPTNTSTIITSSLEDEKLPQKQTKNTKDLCSAEFEQLKKENDELRSQLKEFQFLFSFYIKSSNDDNYFIDQKEEEQYQKVVSKIGEGATSITYKVIDTRNKSFLCKKVLKDDNNAFKNAQNMMKEFEILHKLKHPCICQAYWINTSEIVKDANIEIKEDMTEKTTVSLFLEFLNHKLSDLLKKNIDNTLKVRIVVEIVHAMNFIHKQGMIHRDLKIDNIMLNSVYEAKVVDFGLARIHELFDSNYSFLNESMSKGVGTLAYMSPEMLNESDYDYKTDVYSFGIVLYFIFLGNLPKQTMKDKTNGKSIDLPSSSSSISNFCIDLIKRCLSFDPSERPSFEDILADIRKNEYMLASYIDQSVISIRDHELELFNKYQK